MGGSVAKGPQGLAVRRCGGLMRSRHGEAGEVPSLAQLLGAWLCRLRLERRLLRADVGASIGAHPTKITRVETGVIRARPRLQQAA